MFLLGFFTVKDVNRQYFDRVIKSDHVNGHLKKKASLPLVSLNRCKSKVHSVDILEGLSLTLFTVQCSGVKSSSEVCLICFHVTIHLYIFPTVSFQEKEWS